MVTEADFTTIETIKLSPMPLWEHLSPEEYQARVRNMIEGIAEEARERNRARGKRAMASPWCWRDTRTADPSWHLLLPGEKACWRRLTHSSAAGQIAWVSCSDSSRKPSFVGFPWSPYTFT